MDKTMKQCCYPDVLQNKTDLCPYPEKQCRTNCEYYQDPNNSIEALRRERDEYKVKAEYYERINGEQGKLLDDVIAERDMWKETDLRDAKRVDELAAYAERLREVLLLAEQHLAILYPNGVKDGDALCCAVTLATNLPHDDTCLRQAKAKLLRDAATKLSYDKDGPTQLHRMADELEAGK
jgi:hypothetical protein